MKKILCAFAFAVILSGSAFGASESEMKRMSVFISNFTEVGMYHIDIDDISDSELAFFGIWHNWHNNFKSRIQRCPNKNCPYGGYIIDKKYVAESVKKYFDTEIDHQSTENPKWGYYDGKKYYHFEGATGEAVQARVTSARKRGDTITMRGVSYWPDNDEIEGRPFTATATPYKYNGKNTGAILTLEVEE